MYIDLTDEDLTKKEREDIRRLLQRKSELITTDLEQIWYLMDLVWDDYGCDNRKLDWENITKFYSHSVWLLNGLFIEQDNISMGHRHAISDWIVKNNFKNIVDYGGGFGTLARLVAQKNKNIKMNVYEPHPSQFGLKRANKFKNINIIRELDRDYDCLMSTDVLEHTPDPLKNFFEMIGSVEVGGHLVVANCFYPVIKCHLPQGFHFRYSFNIFAKIMGLRYIGIVEGSHAIIFKKIEDKKVNWLKIRVFEKLSKSVFFIISPVINILKLIRRLVVN
jgi:2-polyprenyl-3-methyl-5-hydroxy-6-metoxy-1,4-benzoquinol methylase